MEVLRLPNLAAAKNRANSLNTIAKANNPEPNVSASILPSNFNAPAIVIIAIPNTTRLLDVEASFLHDLLNNLVAEAIVSIITPRPSSPVSICSRLIEDIIFKANDNTNNADAIDNNELATPRPLTGPIIAIAP